MNYVPKINRRTFVIGAAAAGGGLALGLDIPFGGPEVARAAGRLAGDQRLGRDQARRHRRRSASPAPRWARVADRPRTARRRRARMRLVEGDDRISRRPARTSPASASWGDLTRRGSRGIRESHEYVRKGGAAAREMLKQAAANEWKVPVASARSANGVITHKASGRTTTYGKVAEAAAKLEPPEDVKLKDPKDWKIAGKPLKRLDTADKVTGKQVTHDSSCPDMLNAAIKECPVFGGKLKSFDAAKVAGMPGVKKVVQIGRRRRRGGGRHLVAGQDRARRAADRLGRGRERQGFERLDRRVAEGRPRRRDQAFVGNQQGDAKAASPARRRRSRPSTPIRSRTTPAMEPMNATALYTRDKCEVWTSSQNAEAAFAAAVRGVGPAGRQVRRAQHLPRRRLRPARAQRIRRAGGAHRQGDAGHADQAHLVARRGHDPRRLPPDHAVQADRRARRGQQPDRTAHAHLRPVDPGRGAPRGAGERHGPGNVSRVSIQAARKARSATPSRTC